MSASLPSSRSLHVRAKEPLVGQLMLYAAAAIHGDPDAAFPWRLDHVPERQFRWLMAAGMAPLLYRGTWQQAHLLPEQWRGPLHSAHLTAQVVHGNLVDTANEVIDICIAHSVPVTLLKGISTSGELYPAPHLRPMGDIDVLVPADRYAEVEAALLREGFRQPPYHVEDIGSPYHGPPFHHRARRTWVELHTALFPRNSDLLFNTLFHVATLEREQRASAFHGRNVYRLSHELQLVYIAASWIRDMTTHRISPSFVTSIFDAIYLLKKCELDWAHVVRLLDNELAAASLHVMLRFLERRRLFEFAPDVLSRIARAQHLVGPLQSRLIQAMLDRHVAGGRYWNLALPPPVPGRYSAHRQWRKRFGNRTRQAPVA